MSNIKQYIKLRTFIRDNFTCAYCGKSMSNNIKLTIDHVFPKKLGGTNHINNLITSCVNCNKLKETMLLTDYIKKYNIKITKRISNFL